MYIRIQLLVNAYSVFIVRSVYMRMLESSLYTIMRSGAYVYIGFSSAIYMYMNLFVRIVLDHWLYIALLLWSCTMAFASGLVIGFIWILFT